MSAVYQAALILLSSTLFGQLWKSIVTSVTERYLIFSLFGFQLKPGRPPQCMIRCDPVIGAYGCFLKDVEALHYSIQQATRKRVRASVGGGRPSPRHFLASDEWTPNGQTECWSTRFHPHTKKRVREVSAVSMHLKPLHRRLEALTSLQKTRGKHQVSAVSISLSAVLGVPPTDGDGTLYQKCVRERGGRFAHPCPARPPRLAISVDRVRIA